MKKTAGDVTRNRLGWMVFAGLTALTIIEFLTSALVRSALAYLVVIALIKTSLVVYYFMHVAQLWRRERIQE